MFLMLCKTVQRKQSQLKIQRSSVNKYLRKMHNIKGLHQEFNLELRINGNLKLQRFKFLLVTVRFLTSLVRSLHDILQSGKDKLVGQNETASLSLF